MDANPRNEREEIEWTEGGHKARQENIKSLYQQKSSAPRELHKTSDKRAKAHAYTRCSDMMEFNVPYAPGCLAVTACL
ncbi:uncharacterized protein N7458_009942 [Penicillium daleae]|uniref:Uncharacterized protein n=1 Tax=Penicillium daleae TaxID=63821 RepID=A0AAD6FZF3_9EURO|nr:uncharacterized protein N7458_009942 [Penicillium daleae]KAJ5438944.1 hypothetical protein N7458_009942 [Penicillium daleae]